MTVQAPSSAPARCISFWLSFVDLEGAAAQFRAIQRRNSFIGFPRIGHFHKGKAARAASLAIGNDADSFHRAVRFEHAVPGKRIEVHSRGLPRSILRNAYPVLFRERQGRQQHERKVWNVQSVICFCLGGLELLELHYQLRQRIRVVRPAKHVAVKCFPLRARWLRMNHLEEWRLSAYDCSGRSSMRNVIQTVLLIGVWAARSFSQQTPDRRLVQPPSLPEIIPPGFLADRDPVRVDPLHFKLDFQK